MCKAVPGTFTDRPGLAGIVSSKAAKNKHAAFVTIVQLQTLADVKRVNTSFRCTHGYNQNTGQDGDISRRICS